MDREERTLLIKAMREHSFEEKARGPKGTGKYHSDAHQRRVVDAMGRGQSRPMAELSARLNGKVPGQQEPTPKGYISPQEKKRRGSLRYRATQRIKDIFR